MIESQHTDLSSSGQPIQGIWPHSVKTDKDCHFIMRGHRGVEALVHLTSKNTFHKAIFKALSYGVTSDWFQELGDLTQLYQFNVVHPFVTWMNVSDKDRTSKNRYQCLIDFNLYRKNEINVKKGTVRCLKRIIEHGLLPQHLTPEESTYLHNLLKASQVPPDEKAQGHSLTRWFSQFDLRKSLGEQKFLSLESPRQLITSFRVTIAVTLSVLIEARQLWKERPDHKNKPDVAEGEWYSQWNSSILKHKGRFANDGAPEDILTELLSTDLVMQRARQVFFDKVRAKDINSLSTTLNSKRVWQKPKLFVPDYGDSYTEVEQVLASWLIASLAVQPADISKLKLSNFAIEYMPDGRLHLMQIKYFKGRSGLTKETDIIPGSDVLASALLSYIKNLPDGKKLFDQNVNKSLQFPNLRSLSSNSRFGLLFRIWSIPTVKARLDSEISRAKTSPLFTDAMQAIVDSESKFANQKDVEGSDRKTFITLFRLAHIKTTAVHAQSDKYRESDLVNHNSHTSLTEKQAYLTDQNAEWINQCGRVTRLVLNDLQKTVYQPSMGTIKRKTSELLARSRVTQDLEIGEKNIKDINSLHDVFVNEDNTDQLIVPDTVDAAVYFIHYIKQAETMFETLVRLRPDFVERTLIIRIEWMSQMLTKMKAARVAQMQYAELHKHLPPAFDYLLQTHE